MLKIKLYNILRKLDSLNTDKAEIMEKAVEARLEGALKNYYEELESTIEYLVSKNPVDVLKEISKRFEE